MGVGGVTSIDKALFFWAQQGFGYGYGRGFRDQNTPNLDKGILKVNEGFWTSEQRDVIGTISIHVGDLLISGSGMFIEQITKKKEGKFELDSYGWNEAIYLRMEIAKVGDGEFGGITLASGNYAGGINHIGIPHERTDAGAARTVNGRRTNDFAVGIRKVDAACANCTHGRDLRRFGRRANVSGGELLEVLEQCVWILENGEKEVPPSESKEDSEHMPGFAKFTGERQKGGNKVNLPKKKNKQIDT